MGNEYTNDPKKDLLLVIQNSAARLPGGKTRGYINWPKKFYVNFLEELENAGFRYKGEGAPRVKRILNGVGIEGNVEISSPNQITQLEQALYETGWVYEDQE